MELPVTLVGWAMLAGVAALTALSAIGLRFGINYTQANIKNDLFDRLCKWAGTYVTALAQDPSLEGLASEEKKEYAMLWLMNKAGELGIELSQGEASKLIEQAVWLLKNSALPGVAEALTD